MYARIPAPDGLYVDESESKDEEDKISNESNKEEETCPIENRKNKPKNISKHLWEKFQSLQKRTDEVTKRSTEKRIKHLQKQTISKVQEEISNPEDLDILRAHDVRLGPPNNRNSESKTQGKKRKNETETSKESSNSSVDPEWSEVRALLTVNDHLKGVDRGKHGAKCELERRVDAAVEGGNVREAERLSDQLATRDFGKKIADAFDARNYLREKKEEEESTKAKKKKKLHWGFEQKQRWETKGNM